MLPLQVLGVSIARLFAVVVTGVLATVGSWALGFGVMTSCTSTTSECSATEALLVVGWVLQGALLAAAAALWVPRVARRFTPAGLAGVALAVAVVSALGFAGTAWAADRSFCRGDDAARDFCDVRLASALDR